MRLGLALALAGSLAALAPGALAHGQSIEVAKDVGKYHVTFYTYDTLSEYELVRLAWNVTDRTTQQLTNVSNPILVKEDYDVSGGLVNRTTVNLTQRTAGFLFTDVHMGPEGRAAYTVNLPSDAPQPTVQFDNHVYPGTTPPGGVPLKGTPVAPWLAFAAFLVAALAARRR